jgi:DNA-directed RNA polymerase specialized sigma24 family protein
MREDVVEDVSMTGDELLRSIARSVNLLLKLKIREAQGDRKLNEMILLLHDLRFRPKEIAEALGKTPNDVNPVISRARKNDGARRGRTGKK